MSSGTKKMMGSNHDPVWIVYKKAIELIQIQGKVPPIQVVDAGCWQAILKRSLSKVPQHIFNMDVSDHFSKGHFFYSRFDCITNEGELTLIENDLFLACHDIAGCSERMVYPEEHHCRVGYDQDRNCVAVFLMDRKLVNHRFDIALFFRQEDIVDYKAELESIIPGLKPFVSSDYGKIHSQMPEWKSMFDQLIQ